MAAIADAIKAGGARILFLDIERFKGRAEIEFWDLNDMKGRRIHPDSVVEWPRTICAAWKWYGVKRIHFASEWGDTPDGFFRACWDAYDEADIVVGHNIDGFDTKHLNQAWWERGWGEPSPYRSVDTLKVARRKFGAESKTLDALLKRLGLAGKTDRYDVELARRALAGHGPSQLRLKRYNVGDITATEALYEALKGWNPSHPHMGLYTGQERCCYQCGGTNLVQMVKDTKTPRTAYATWRCTDCQATSRNNHRRSIVTLVPAR